MPCVAMVIVVLVLVNVNVTVCLTFWEVLAIKVCCLLSWKSTCCLILLRACYVWFVIWIRHLVGVCSLDRVVL